MNRKQSPAPRQAIALSYDGQAAPTFPPRATPNWPRRSWPSPATTRYRSTRTPSLVRLLARLELGDAIPEALYRTIAEIIAFAWHLKGKCPEGFAPDAADGNQMLLLGGPGD